MLSAYFSYLFFTTITFLHIPIRLPTFLVSFYCLEELFTKISLSYRSLQNLKDRFKTQYSTSISLFIYCLYASLPSSTSSISLLSDSSLILSLIYSNIHYSLIFMNDTDSRATLLARINACCLSKSQVSSSDTVVISWPSRCNF